MSIVVHRLFRLWIAIAVPTTLVAFVVMTYQSHTISVGERELSAELIAWEERQKSAKPKRAPEPPATASSAKADPIDEILGKVLFRDERPWRTFINNYETRDQAALIYFGTLLAPFVVFALAVATTRLAHWIWISQNPKAGWASKFWSDAQLRRSALGYCAYAGIGIVSGGAALLAPERMHYIFMASTAQAVSLAVIAWAISKLGFGQKHKGDA